MKYRAAILGAGRIGAMGDDPQSALILTHAHGYTACEGFEIVGFVDSNPNKAVAASTRWGGRPFETFEQLLDAQPVDVVSVCLPDELHYPALLTLAQAPVKFIFLEKPAVQTPAEANEVRNIYRDLPVRVQVNYTRRFVPEIRSVHETIKSGAYGKFLTGVGYYGKGLLHNGSHMLDLVQFLLGDFGDIARISETNDFYDHDPSVSAQLTLRSGGVFYLSHIDCRRFHVFELDLIFENGRVRVFDLGTKIENYSVGDHPVFDGYRTLNKAGETATQHSKAMFHAIASIRDNLDRNQPLVCTLEASLRTVDACARILLGGRPE